MDATKSGRNSAVHRQTTIAEPVPETLAAQAMNKSNQRVASAGFLIAGIALAKLLVHLYAGRHYGYFVDALYYLACSDHLDWGYVD